jgi:hypothetical protein
VKDFPGKKEKREKNSPKDARITEIGVQIGIYGANNAEW